VKLIYVIAWRYSDGSASGVVSAHGTREGAEIMLGILAEQGDSMRGFSIHEVPFQEQP
jgi:hypothetical protein